LMRDMLYGNKQLAASIVDGKLLLTPIGESPPEPAAVPVPLPPTEANGYHFAAYFASRDINGKTLHLRRGELLPLQDKTSVRQLAQSLGETDADCKPITEFSFVTRLLVRSDHDLRCVLSENLTFEAARARYGGEARRTRDAASATTKVRGKKAA